jgi:two-component system KDP operon response regulator KdpE
MTILVVEDNAITRNIVRLSLSSRGYRILEASDAASAISIVAEQKPDLIIQDLGLPDIDGKNLAQILHNLPGREDVPIVAFSAFVDKLEEVRAMEGLFTAFLPKPIQPSKLVALVERIISADRKEQVVR